MAKYPLDPTPFLAQVPVTELAQHLSPGSLDGSAPVREVRRRAGLSRVGKRSASLLFLGLGVVSMLSLGRSAAAAFSMGLSVDDAGLLVMLGLISMVVISQVFALLRTLPGTRRIWRWAAIARQRRVAPTPGRPLLAQAETRSLLGLLSPTPRLGTGGSRLRSAAATAGWVALTLVIMAAAIAGTRLVALSAIRSIGARGWGFSDLVGLGVASLVGYGVTAMSIGLIRSWFERRRRRLRRMLTRLLRYVLRGFDRSVTAFQHIPGRLDGAAGLLGGSTLATGGVAVVVTASLAMSPVSAVVGTATNTDSTSTTTIQAVGVDHRTIPGIVAAETPPGEGEVEASISDPTPTVTVDPVKATTTTTTTTKPTTTTTTTATKPTTTTTTTTTTVPGRDITGPVVSRVSDGPDPIFTSGSRPDTSEISFTISDPSGVDAVTVYYRVGGESFAVWASLKPGTGSTQFGPFAKAGTYEYRIMATDTLGNTNCKTPATCPGGTVTVIIP